MPTIRKFQRVQGAVANADGGMPTIRKFRRVQGEDLLGWLRQRCR